MRKQDSPRQPLSDAEIQAITDLVTGQLSPLASWRLRRRIAASPVLARELKEIEALHADLRLLQTEEVTQRPPVWGSTSATAHTVKSSSFWILGGIAMNRRVVVAATAALCLLCVTGGYAAVHYLYKPFHDMDAGNGLVWHADHHFRGEVKFYDVNGTYQGSNGTDGEDNAPVSATVTVSGQSFPVFGAGRHAIEDKSGKLLGTVELVPETKEEREAWRQKHNREMGIEQQLHISYGAKDGYGQCIGFFGDEPNRITWKLSGTNVRVLFFDQSTGKQVYSGKAGPVDDAIRAEQKQSLSPESYAATVAEQVPSEPYFSWTTPDGKQHTFMTFRSYPMALPDGTKLRVEIVPEPQQ